MRNVPPTKSNLMKLKEELEFARLGRELLDQKRSILVSELMNLVDLAIAREDRVNASLEKAHIAFEDASLTKGYLRLSSLTSAIDTRSNIRLGSRKVMGLSLPVVETDFTDNPPYYSPMDTSARLDNAVAFFKDAVKEMGKLAELKISVMRLAREVKKTIRKVNALEKIAIPELEETVNFIHDRLEENEREVFTLMKVVKNRLAKRGEE